jgi:hypothetical protein
MIELPPKKCWFCSKDFELVYKPGDPYSFHTCNVDVHIYIYHKPIEVCFTFVNKKYCCSWNGKNLSEAEVLINNSKTHYIQLSLDDFILWDMKDAIEKLNTLILFS